MAEELTFHLEEFEGPLELLLGAGVKAQDGPAQHPHPRAHRPVYPHPWRPRRPVDPDISSSFIEMAAHLVEMKSYLLLPRSTEASG
mgnify:CR=1 FL=1